MSTSTAASTSLSSARGTAMNSSWNPGRTLANVSRMRVRTYKVAVEDGDVVLYA